MSEAARRKLRTGHANADGVYDCLTGLFASACTTHAVGHAESAPFRNSQNTILVGLALEAGIGQRSAVILKPIHSDTPFRAGHTVRPPTLYSLTAIGCKANPSDSAGKPPIPKKCCAHRDTAISPEGFKGRLQSPRSATSHASAVIPI